MLGPPDYLAQRRRLLQPRSNTAEQEGERLSCMCELRALLFEKQQVHRRHDSRRQGQRITDSEKPAINFAGSNNDFDGNFTFPAAATRRFTPNTKATTLLVDSGASELFLDDELIPGLKERMREFKELSTPKEIITAWKHTIYGVDTPATSRSPSATATTPSSRPTSARWLYQASDATSLPQQPS